MRLRPFSGTKRVSAMAFSARPRSVADGSPESRFAPQAIYYRGVSRYSASHDHTELGTTAKTLKEKHEGNEWQLRSIPWLAE